MRSILFLCVVATLLMVGNAIAADDDGIVTERPSFVDSSETVGNGKLQIETGVQDARNSGSNDWTLPTLLRWGIADDWEARFESDVFERSNADTAHYVDGWSNLTIGVKHHVGGTSDGGPSSAWFAEVELPTGASPYRGQGARPSARWVTEWDLPDDFSLGLMPGIKYDNGDAGRFVSGSFGATLGKNFGDATQVFVELASPQITTPRFGGTQLSFDSGVQYKIGKNFQLDAAVFFGMNDHTPDATFTVGASSRW